MSELRRVPATGRRADSTPEPSPEPSPEPVRRDPSRADPRKGKGKGKGKGKMMQALEAKQPAAPKAEQQPPHEVTLQAISEQLSSAALYVAEEVVWAFKSELSRRLPRPGPGDPGPSDVRFSGFPEEWLRGDGHEREGGRG